MWKLSRLSRYISRSSRLFLEYPDTFFRLSGHYIIWKGSSSSRHFLDHPETFQFIRTLCVSLRIIWIFCTVSGHFPKYPEILQPIMSLLQKLSRQNCWRAGGFFLTLLFTGLTWRTRWWQLWQQLAWTQTRGYELDPEDSEYCQIQNLLVIHQHAEYAPSEIRDF